MTDVIRVAIIDDHAIIRSGLGSFLAGFDDMMLVGEGEDGRDALTICQDCQPHVLLMNITMPGMDGVEVTAAIRAAYPNVRILVMTGAEDDEFGQRALEAGAVGVLTKDLIGQELAEAIRGAHHGISTARQPEMMPSFPEHDSRSIYDLKEREREILALLAEGLTNSQMAEHLSLSLSTIKFYVSEILSKLHAQSRVEAVAIALREGLLRSDDHDA
jgi:NarL family two-component system response regulator LiaR